MSGEDAEPMKSGRVVVAGCAGFLGSHLVDALLGRDCEVIGLDDLSTGRIENLAHLESNEKFSFMRSDITDGVSVDGTVDLVMNLASPASPVDYLRLPLETLAVGSQGSLALLELARTKAAAYFYSSTSEVYGDPLVHPQSEGYWGNVNPIGPRSVYDESKRFGEALTFAYQRTHGLDVKVVRIFNTYGPRMRPDDGRVVSNFIVQALRGDLITIYGDGTQTRSFCFVDDEINGVLAMVDHGAHGPINIGNDSEFTVSELAELVVRLTGSESPIVYEPLPTDDPKQRRPDLTLARTVLNWEPKVMLEEGLSRTIAYFQALNGDIR